MAAGALPRPRWGAYDAPPDTLIVRGIGPSALATLVSILRSQFPFRAPSLLNSWIRHWAEVHLKCGDLKRRLQVAQVRTNSWLKAGDGLYEHLNWFYSAG